jgi:hypothetical protein
MDSDPYVRNASSIFGNFVGCVGPEANQLSAAFRATTEPSRGKLWKNGSVTQNAPGNPEEGIEQNPARVPLAEVAPRTRVGVKRWVADCEGWSSWVVDGDAYRSIILGGLDEKSGALSATLNGPAKTANELVSDEFESVVFQVHACATLLLQREPALASSSPHERREHGT